MDKVKENVIWKVSYDLNGNENTLKLQILDNSNGSYISVNLTKEEAIKLSNCLTGLSAVMEEVVE